MKIATADAMERVLAADGECDRYRALGWALRAGVREVDYDAVIAAAQVDVPPLTEGDLADYATRWRALIGCTSFT